MSTTTKDRVKVLVRLERLGLAYKDAQALRRIAMTLHRWFELECGDGNAYASWSIERDEETGKPYRCVYAHNDKMRRTPIPDRETGARKRLATILAKYPTLHAYVQPDPRGAALFLLTTEQIQWYDNLPLDEIYSHGVAVY